MIRRIFILLFIPGVCISQTNKTSPLFYLSFDGNFKNTVDGKDFSTMGMKNIVLGEDRFGNSNHALLINEDNYGGNGLVIPFQKESFVTNREMTISLWFKTKVSCSQLLGASPVANSVSSEDEDMNINMCNKSVSATFLGKATTWDERKQNNAVTGGYTNGYALNDGNWHFLILYINDTTFNYFIDNLYPSKDEYNFEYKFRKSPISYFLECNYFFVGTHSDRGSYIDDILIYNRKLSAEERENLFFSIPELNRLPPFSTANNSNTQYFKYYYNRLIKKAIAEKNKDYLLKLISSESVYSDYFYESDLKDILTTFDYSNFSKTKIYSELLKIKNVMTDEVNAIKLEQKRLQEMESKRVSYIKKATVGDIMVYTQDWEHKESWLLGYFQKNTQFKMIIKCFIERIEGEKFQVRIADVSSNNNEKYATPQIKGIDVRRGDIIWIKPFQDKNWFWGEDN